MGIHIKSRSSSRPQVSSVTWPKSSSAPPTTATSRCGPRPRWIWRVIFGGELLFFRFGHFLGDFCFPASFLFCFLFFLRFPVVCFYSSLILCFSTFLLLCFFASSLLCFSTVLPLCFCASLLFPAFPASLLTCFSDSLRFPPFLFLILQIILKKHHVNKP